MVPTSLRSMVWNGLDSVLLVVAYWPVTKGTFWPMMMRASSLSSVSRFGVARMLLFVSVSSARASRPRFRKFWPKRLTPLRTTPTFRPPAAATAAGFCVTFRMLLPPVPKLVPPTTELWPGRLVPNCHWMPISATVSALTSTISDSM